MKYLSVLLIFICLSSYSQEDKKGTIKVVKHDCCSDLDLWLFHSRNLDTISYEILIKEVGLIVSPVNCNKNSRYTIVSFELKVNNKNSVFVKGNQFNFKNLSELKGGGKVEFINCIVECNVEGYELKKTIILPKTFYITASK